MSSVGNEIQQMLDEIRGEACLEPLDEEKDLTRNKIMKELRISSKATEYLTNKMVDSGKWTKTFKKHNGRRVAVFHITTTKL